MAQVDEWIRRNGLQLAHDKTEAILLTGRRKTRKPALEIRGVQVEI